MVEIWSVEKSSQIIEPNDLRNLASHSAPKVGLQKNNQKELTESELYEIGAAARFLPKVALHILVNELNNLAFISKSNGKFKFSQNFYFAIDHIMFFAASRFATSQP